MMLKRFTNRKKSFFFKLSLAFLGVGFLIYSVGITKNMLSFKANRKVGLKNPPSNSKEIIPKDQENMALLKLRERVKIKSQSPDSKGIIPLEDFFKNSEISHLKLSPNGKYLAYLKPYKNRMNIHVRPLDDSEPERRITNQTERDIRGFGWKENDTLVFMKDFGGDENFHIFRVSAKGEEERDLTPFKDTKVQIIDWLKDISEDHILIETNQREKTVFDVYRLNVETGDIQLVLKNTKNFASDPLSGGYLTDHEGKVRVAVSRSGADSLIYYRETEQEEFQKIMTIALEDNFNPLLFDFDNKNFYVASNLGRDKTAIQIFDPKTKKILSTLFDHPEVDVYSLSYSKKRKIITSVSYTTWKKQRHFFDSVKEEIFKHLQPKFPGKRIGFASSNKEEDLRILFVSSDRDPGTYYLYNTNNKNLKKIATPRPWLKEESLSEVRPVLYISRDGLNIHGYLTLPKGHDKGTKLPVVIFPHGGPWSRDIWRYDPFVQFLASRGYAVFQMNFRGSTGYGKKFWLASVKQWGKKMQDDITDGVQYLIDDGIADENKIAIFGGSYGGYAVLAGLAFTPDLYACGVDYVGVSNLFTFMESIPPYWELLREKLYKLIGHPEKDKQLLREASPFFHADKIKVPLFVVQGANDPRVKKAESDQIVKVLEDRGVQVPYLVKDNEGHGFHNEENNLEFIRLMEVFLEDCLR